MSLIQWIDENDIIREIRTNSQGELVTSSTPTTTSLGQKAMSASTSVAIANDQSPVPTQDKNGEGAVTYITNTTPVSWLTARQVVCLTDTTFTTFTRTNSTGSIVGIPLPAWTLLIWPVTAVTLTSGAVACYN